MFEAISGRVDDFVLKRALLNLRFTGSDRLFIESSGGALDHVLPVVEEFEQRKMLMLAGEQVHSAAITLYLSGARRLAFPYSTFLFHLVGYTGVDGVTISLPELEIQLDIARALRQPSVSRALCERMGYIIACQETSMRYQARRTNRDPSLFLTLRRHRVELTAWEARDLGIVHEIITEDEANALGLHCF